MSPRAHEASREDRIDRLEIRQALSLPIVLAIVTAYVPMFRPFVGEDATGWPGVSRTLLGLAMHPGSGGTTGLIAALAWVSFLLVLACVLCSASVVFDLRSRWLTPGQVAAVLGFFALLGLWAVTVPDDGSGRLGTDDYQPTAGLFLAFGVTVWFAAAASFARSVRGRVR